MVTPGTNELYVADPAAAEEIMRRCRDREFVQREMVYQVLDVFGPNVDSVNGKVWERHRRITVPPFNERISGCVWDEAGRQAKGALEVWLANSREETVRSTQNDCMKIALHVLTRAGFGVSYDFSGEGKTVNRSGRHKLTYRDALRTLLDNMVIVFFLRIAQQGGWPLWATWGRARKVLDAHAEFQDYMTEMMAEEKTRMQSGEKDRGNLMSVLVRSSEQAKLSGKIADDGAAGRNTFQGLTDEEVYGNMFIYNLAGHDTTANTIHIALTILAIHPEWQVWVAEEIDRVVGTGEEHNRVYEDVFPKLPRCLALMYETQRLYPSVPCLPRWTADTWQQISVGGTEIMIPPQTNVMVNSTALQTHPKYWGPDPLVFRPDRWTVNAQEHQQDEIDADGPHDWQSTSLLQPVPGSFVAWSAGPRICPGKKFSQVEFVSVIAMLFSNNSRVEVVREKDEMPEDAKRRVARVLAEAKTEIALKVPNAESIGMRWFRKVP
ncbi:hypothetical protein LTR05_008560 [Lithohypha guttulata]|uniref:Cytochrome P450 n=1 Tax=Lithohypha guttulata TaxID=1690604 RepID=A0AAN7QAD1_9EURO|nr:hypothetical protein LTR05_008560 [Lithohypha guttulata]